MATKKSSEKLKKRRRLSDPKAKRKAPVVSSERRSAAQKASRAKYKSNGFGTPYKMKAILEGYKENNLLPAVIDPKRPLFNSTPLFVKQPSVARRIVKYLKEGHNFTTVCKVVGINYSTLKDWLQKGRDGFSADYVNFYLKVQAAEARAEIKQLETLKTHEAADWRVSAWQLERRFPEHWAKKDRIKAEMHVNTIIQTTSKEDLSKTISSDESARELARKMIDGNEFGYTVEE